MQRPLAASALDSEEASLPAHCQSPALLPCREGVSVRVPAAAPQEVAAAAAARRCSDCDMFYHLELDKEVELQPRSFGPNLRKVVEQKLATEVDGTCDGRYGFMLAVLKLTGLGKGRIRDGTGSAVFDVRYQCLVFRPFKGEVMDCVVESVNKVGFFANAGPLQLFVSNHLIPEDYEFSAADEPAFVSADQAVRILAGAEVRLRIVGTRMDATQIFCVGTIKEDYLGVISPAVAA